MALHIKYSSYDSGEFPPENHLLHAFVSSIPVILAFYNRRVVKLLSHVDSWHICAKAVQSLSFLNISFDSEPMLICIQEDIMRFNRKQKKLQKHMSLVPRGIEVRDWVAGKGLGCILHPHTGSPKVRI